MTIPEYQRDAQGIPNLTYSDINILAREFVNDFQPNALSDSVPFNIDEFMEFYLCMNPDYQLLSHNMSCLAMTVFGDTDRIPIFNPYHHQAEYSSAKANTVVFDRRLALCNNESLYRYIAAVECGHVILHRSVCNHAKDSSRRFMESYSRNIIYSDCDADHLLETQAKKFANSLLMPDVSVMNIIDPCGISVNDMMNAAEKLSIIYAVPCCVAMDRIHELKNKVF